MQTPPIAGAEGRALLAMARNGDAAGIMAAVQQLGMPVDYQNAMGQTPLMVAALWGNVHAMAALLQLGADPNKTNIAGAAALHFAAGAKRLAREACALLVQAGADTAVMDQSGRMPYELTEDQELRRALGGPDPRLFELAAAGDAAGLKQLVLSGAVPSMRALDPDGRHVLNVAVFENEETTDVVKLLLEIDPELARIPDMTGSCALHVAAEGGNAAAAALLLKALRPGDVDQRNLNLGEYSQGDWQSSAGAITPWDKTPLALAVDAGDADMARLLLEAGADPNIPDFDGAAPLHAAVAAQDAELAALLLAKGADPNRPSKDTASCLHAAAQRGPLELLELLLRHGADAQAANGEGWSALHLAARAGAAAKVRLLLAAGADPRTATQQGHTPLSLAVANRRTEVQQLLEAATASSSAAAAAPGSAAAPGAPGHTAVALPAAGGAAAALVAA